MVCKECGSDNVHVEIINDYQLEKKTHGFLYWALIGWWLHLLLWFFFTFFMILRHIFAPKKYKSVRTEYKVAICNNCGKSWTISKRKK